MHYSPIEPTGSARRNGIDPLGRQGLCHVVTQVVGGARPNFSGERLIRRMSL